MPINFKAAMSKAAELTRSRKLMDATRVIQSALSSARQVSAPPSSTPKRARRDEAAARPKRPLADVLSVLGRAKGNGLSPFSLPGATPRNAPPVPDGAQFLTRSFSNTAGTRNYRLYVPARAPEGARTLIVMLHGCKQNPDDFAAGTGMNALAEEHGFLVAYPEQPGSANQMSCWNWFEPKDQRRDSGEPSIIAGITRQIAGEFDIDPAKIFVAGLSAGGAMAVIVGATYPDLFHGVGVHSGLPYEAAKDVPGAFMAMRGDNGLGMLRSMARAPVPAENPVRTIIFHGDADQTVHPSNADRIVAALNPAVQSGGDHTRSGTAEGRAYTQSAILDGAGKPVGEHWVIKGAGHAWSGGNPAGSYTDPRGPDASREMVRFFMG